MSGLINFRDFGGYPTKDGRSIKKGIFYRCGSYRDLTENDREMLRALNIQNLCDFRENSELDLPEYRETFAKNVHTISASAHLGTFDEDTKDDFVFSSDSMRDFYTKLVFDNPGYKNIMKVLLEDEATPYLHNCTAGKDRTGLGTALIQLLLGVDEHIVMADYMKSMDAIEEVVGNERRRLQSGEPVESLYHKFIGLVVMPSYLQAALDTIKDKYETYEAYFESEYGIGALEIKKLKELYTEEN